MEKIKKFLSKKNVEISVNVYGIKVLGSMAMGLFASLLIGTILKTIGLKLNIPYLTETVAPIASEMTGPAMAVAIASSLNAPSLVLFSSIIPGYIGNKLGGPVGTLIAVLIGVEIGKLVSKETPFDIILTPAVTIIIGSLIASFAGPPLGALMNGLGNIIMVATELKPFMMGIIVSAVVGIVLTLPISSAALCIMLGLSGIAAGAATAGCCAQMIGFAFMSYKENGINGLLAQGLGTSMLQVPNIVKNWKIWIPPTLASIVTGPIATVIFHMENDPMGAGMGTCGLVGLINTVSTMSKSYSPFVIYGGIILDYIILPAIISIVIYEIMYKKGLIKKGDVTLPQN